MNGIINEQCSENHGIITFLCSLSPGMGIMLQYDSQPPACGTFQGIVDGTVLVSDFNGFPGLTRISQYKINAVAPFCPRDEKIK